MEQKKIGMAYPELIELLEKAEDRLKDLSKLANQLAELKSKEKGQRPEVISVLRSEQNDLNSEIDKVTGNKVNPRLFRPNYYYESIEYFIYSINRVNSNLLSKCRIHMLNESNAFDAFEAFKKMYALLFNKIKEINNKKFRKNGSKSKKFEDLQNPIRIIPKKILVLEIKLVNGEKLSQFELRQLFSRHNYYSRIMDLRMHKTYLESERLVVIHHSSSNHANKRSSSYDDINNTMDLLLMSIKDIDKKINDDEDDEE